MPRNEKLPKTRISYPLVQADRLSISITATLETVDLDAVSRLIVEDHLPRRGSPPMPELSEIVVMIIGGSAADRSAVRELARELLASHYGVIRFIESARQQ